MSISLLIFMGSIKIGFVSYAYSINMYCILLLLVTGKRKVKSVYNFTVSGFSRPIASNKECLFSSLQENKIYSISSAICSLFIDLMLFCDWSKFPKIFASNLGRRSAINLDARPGHVSKFLFLIALIKVYFTGLKHVSCKKTCLLFLVFIFVNIVHYVVFVVTHLLIFKLNW